MEIRKARPTIKLQPLRIPSSWEIEYNSFSELDPENIRKEDKRTWVNFTEDLLQTKHKRYNVLIDLGWYPEADPEGCFGIDVIKDMDWENPLETFESRSKSEVVDKIEELLWRLGEGMID